MEKTYKVESVYTLKAPLSHIGESESTETFLNTISIRNGNKVEEVFAYSGNAIRGSWRDAGAKYLLEKLGDIRVPKKTFHLLFTGGSISGNQVVDIEQAKRLRDVFPFISIFGGGVGNQILSGKMNQTFAYPVCLETKNIIPDSREAIDYTAQEISWRQLTGETNFTRTDDAKDRLGDKYIYKDALLLESDKKAKKEQAAQMRYTTEYLIPGTQLWHQLELTGTELELGALVASIYAWAESPHLGGMAAKGFGLVDLDMTIDGEPFLQIASQQLHLEDKAEQSKNIYDQHLKNIYDQYLIENKEEFAKLLEG